MGVAEGGRKRERERREKRRERERERAFAQQLRDVYPAHQRPKHANTVVPNFFFESIPRWWQCQYQWQIKDRVLTADEFVHCEDYGGSQTVGTENDPTSGQIRKRKANSATVSLCCKEHSSQESISIGPGYDLQPEPALVEVYQSPSQPSKKHSTANNAARLDERQVQHPLYHGRPGLKNIRLGLSSIKAATI